MKTTIGKRVLVEPAYPRLMYNGAAGACVWMVLDKGGRGVCVRSSDGAHFDGGYEAGQYATDLCVDGLVDYPFELTLSNEVAING